MEDVFFVPGFHLIEADAEPNTKAQRTRVDSGISWMADRKDTSTYRTKSFVKDMHRSVFEEPPYQIWQELYRELELKAMNTDQEQWDDQQDYLTQLASAEQKLAADSIDLTKKEFSVVRQMIEQRQKSGGFGLLTTGQKYETVLEDLKRYQRRRF